MDPLSGFPQITTPDGSKQSLCIVCGHGRSVIYLDDAGPLSELSTGQPFYEWVHVGWQKRDKVRGRFGKQMLGPVVTMKLAVTNGVIEIDTVEIERSDDKPLTPTAISKIRFSEVLEDAVSVVANVAMMMLA